jgi:hypothetical protein
MPTIIPKLNQGSSVVGNSLKTVNVSNYPFWEENCGFPVNASFGYIYENIRTDISSNEQDMQLLNFSQLYKNASKISNYFWIAEIYRDIDDNFRFGGKTEGAIKNNKWIPVSNEGKLTRDYGIDIITNVGDTYFQRYDHLKTFPQGQGNVNNVVDYISAMVETHINIDGRYDKYRGNTIDLYPTPNDINKLNSAYS